MNLKAIEDRLKRAYSLPVKEQRKFHDQIWALEEERFNLLLPEWDDEAAYQYLRSFVDRLTEIFKGKTVGLLWAVENAKELDKRHQDSLKNIDEAFKKQNKKAFIEALKEYEATLKDIYLAYKENQKVKEG
ncbi:MAG: hypothetical protein PWQ34_1400 [Caldanaerobacter sp.]|uniref:hypothetical protein n=1 Tax=Caldanaerobacter sp. TaxID=2930036 RepID=UPI0024AB2C12|nr:hypothetical protein [Caldanaerobacter sp.]MDI3519253.1 hypothetical protein [Caldanaerobacter sp.]